MNLIYINPLCGFWSLTQCQDTGKKASKGVYQHVIYPNLYFRVRGKVILVPCHLPLMYNVKH